MFNDMRVYTDEYKNGFDLSSMGAILTRESSIDLIPSRSIDTGSVLGKAGSVESGITIGYRTIKPVIHFSTMDLPTDSPFNSYSLDELDDFLTRLFVNNYHPFEIEFPELSGRFYKAYFDSAQTPKFYIADGEVSYVLTCYDPAIYGDEVTGELSSSPTIIDCTDAHLETGLTITVPSGQSGTIAWVHDGQSSNIVINPGLFNSGDIYFETATRRLYDSEGNNLLPSYKSEFPIIQARGLAEFTTEESGIRLSYRKRFLY